MLYLSINIRKRIMAKIAILEDDKFLAEALTVELVSNGFEVVSATDGEKGLELIRKENPDVVLLDIMMPIMDGFEVLEKLQEEKITSKVIVLSNLGEDSDRSKAMGLGAVDYFVKSATDLSKLKPKIKKLLK